jgi:hypothetical protein
MTRRVASSLSHPFRTNGTLVLQQMNPFQLPADSDLFQLRDRQTEDAVRLRAKFQTKSLVDRTTLSFESQAGSGLIFEESGDEGQGGPQLRPPTAEHQRRQQMPEFIDEKREILLAQLLIDRKNKEVERIQNMRKTEKKQIIEELGKIAETSNQYKMTTNQYEAELQRSKKSMDAAIKRRTELSKDLKKKTAGVSVLESEISRNEETLDSYRTYSTFLHRLTPSEADMSGFFTEPTVLLDELENVENENLFLIGYCQEMRDSQDNSVRRMDGSISAMDAETVEIEDAMERLNQIDDLTQLLSLSHPENDELDNSLNLVSQLVRKTYKQCFGDPGDINTLSRLERIENELERLYRQSSNIDASFMNSKQTEKEKARRDIQRREKAEQHERDQKRKLEQALLRAQMPIKRRTGRPVVFRTLPILGATNAAVDQKKQEEEQQQDELLYGELNP